MKTGRNDPCRCGSGKKYKNCCLSKDRDAGGRASANFGAPPRSAEPRPPRNVIPPRPDRARSGDPLAFLPKPPPRPPDPERERWEAFWKEFKSQDGEGRIATYLKLLDDREEMDDTVAFDMLGHLRQDGITRGDRPRFAELVAVLRERRSDLFEESGHFYLCWCLEDALADGRLEAVPALVRELAPYSGQHLDTIGRMLCALAYHGQLAALVEAHRLGWPKVKTTADLFQWAIVEFAEKGARYEIYDSLDQTGSADLSDGALLERIHFFLEEPRLDYLREFHDDLTGKSHPAWSLGDFTLRPPQRRSRDDWDEAEEPASPDQGAVNLARLIDEFVGYLRRTEGNSFARGELVRGELLRYFLRRHGGDLDPRPSMLEAALHPGKTLPKPPPPIHPLCPERITLDVYLAGLVGVFSSLHHTAAALFEVVPAWLRFLEARALLDAETRARAAELLKPLQEQLLKLWGTYTTDPSLLRGAQRWPEDAARGVPEARA